MRLVIMASGSGSNLQAILDAIAGGELKAEVVLVVSNHGQAYALERARRAKIPTLVFPLEPYRSAGRSREAYDADLVAQINLFRPDLIVLAGWMHILSPAFLDSFPSQVINLHPALPGQFPGTHAIERAYDAFQRGEIAHSGCMVHYTIPEIDAGAVITESRVPIRSDDSLEDFEARMHMTEHRLIVEAIQLVAQKRLRASFE